MAAVDSFSLLLREIGQTCNSYTETLALIGALYTAKMCFTFVNDTYTLIRLHFIPRLVRRADLVKLYGKWAVVTGKRHKNGRIYSHSGHWLNWSDVIECFQTFQQLRRSSLKMLENTVVLPKEAICYLSWEKTRQCKSLVQRLGKWSAVRGRRNK